MRNKVITTIETKRLPVLEIELFKNVNIKSCQVTYKNIFFHSSKTNAKDNDTVVRCHRANNYCISVIVLHPKIWD